MNKTKIIEHRFDSISKNYDLSLDRRKNFLKSEEKIISDYINSKNLKNIVILDAGCGTGLRGEKICNEIKAKTKIYGFDISKEMVSLCSSKYFSVKKGNMVNLQFPKQKFGYVFCLFCVITYGDSKENRKKTIENFYKNLRPGGILIIDILNRWHCGEGKFFYKSKLKTCVELFNSIIHPNLEYGDVFFKTNNEGKQVEGYFHSMTDKEFKKLISGLFTIEKKYTIGYDTGELKIDETQGHNLYICKKV